MSTMEFVLRFTLSHHGTSNPVHLASNIAVADMKRPRSAFRSRTPANQKPAASALRDYCRSRVDGRDAADEPDRTLAPGLPTCR
jgi:hypothetical protein